MLLASTVIVHLNTSGHMHIYGELDGSLRVAVDSR